MKLAAVISLAALVAAPGAHAAGLSPDLLLSSAWCTFSYNKTTGYSSSRRVQFGANGTYGVGRQAEGGSSGRNGSMASQSNSGGGGYWRVERGELFMSEGVGQLQHVGTQLRRNSNGYAVIVADGVEYSQCR